MPRLFHHQVAIFASLYAGYAIFVLNRKVFSYVTPALVRDLGLSKGDLGLISSSQTLAYAIAKFSIGVLSDKVSARSLFITGLLLTGVITLVMSSCASVYAFAFMMFLVGAANGCGWPSCAIILKKWYAPTQFGSLWGFLSSSMNFAGAIGPIIAAYITLHYGWHTCLHMAGVTSIVYAGVCVFTVKDSPSDVGFEDFIRKEEKNSTTDATHNNSIKETSAMDLAKNPYLWVLFFAYMMVHAIKMCLQDWTQLYLIQERGQSVLAGSSFVSSLESGGLVGSFAVGFITDRMLLVFEKSSKARTSVLIMNLTMASLIIYLLVFHVSGDSSQLWINSLGFTLGIFVFGSTCVYGVLAVENSPSHLSGSANAFVALGANVGGVLAGLPLSLLAKSYGWRGALLCIDICCAIVICIHMVTFNMDTKATMEMVAKKNVKEY